ncbi:hypothetical protein SNE40_007932 [Patella caerulea]|uniref:[histone H3]-dimethyl-L-lysine(9) demethylase n=1 Tax=Patella caerulea TaxID=87958 RepID=A0AAN8JUQ5_PATCE
MAYKYREELVGKRFLSVKSSGKLKVSKISEWEWRSGVVRAVSSRETGNTEFTVLVEFDDCDWQKREWIKVHEVFQIFWVEHTLVWAYRPDPNKPQTEVIWPGLSFKPLVDKAALGNSKRKPVEFFLDRHLGLVEEKEFQIYQEGDENRQKILDVYPDLKKEVKSWVDYQDGQRIILTTPTVLVGYRVEVYRAEGTTQWYTAVIQSYNHTTKCLAVTDDTVLEEHNEDPALIQMRLIDDGVVDLILRGVEVGIAPRRRPRKDNSTPKEQPAHLARRPNQVLTPQQIQTIRPNRSAKTRQRNPSGGSTPEPEKIVQEKTSRKQPQVQRERKRRSDINETKQLTSPSKKAKSETAKEQVTPTRNDTNTKELKIQVEDIGLYKNNAASSVKEKTKTRRNQSGARTNINNNNTNNNLSSGNSKNSSNILKESKSEPTVKVKVSAKSKSSENRKCKSDKVKSGESSSDVCKSLTDIDKNLTQIQPEDDSKKEKESKSSSKVTSILKTSKDSDNSSEIEDNMHYKKQLLLNSGSNNNSSDSHTGPLTANIDVNLSVIDQVTKLAKAEKLSLNGEDKSESETVTISQNASSIISQEKSDKEDMKTQEINVERPRETNVGFQAYISRSNPPTPAMDERSDSRASDERSTSSGHHEKRPSSQFDDLKTVKSSPASSPLVIDRHDPVLPYRDPELMKQNPVHFLGGVHNIPNHSKSISQSLYPTVHTPIPASPAALPTSTSFSSHPISRQMLTSLPNHYPIPPSMGGISRPLTLPPSFSQLDATLAAHAQQQQQLHVMQLQNAHLMHLQYPLSGHRLHQLEVLWQQKFSSIPVPPSWLLVKHQDELLADVSSLHHREREMERERMERDRLEMERLDRECVERERRKERERQEKERQDKERERLEKEKQEQERLEKERIERNRQEQNRIRREREQKSDRGRILRETVDSVAAVDHHFTESLRLASQRGLGGQWPTPSITLGTGKIPKSEIPPHHSMMGTDKQLDDKERVKREIERERERYQESAHRQNEEKYLGNIPEAHKKSDIKNDVKLESKPSLYNYMYPYGDTRYPTSTSSHGVKQEQPIFSLYGYPANPSVITKDQLHIYGLGRDEGIKDEKPDLKLGQPSPAHSNPRSLSPRSKESLLHMNKDGKHPGSVIVDNRSSKSNSPSSQYGGSLPVSSSSPRPQPRPAHTPEQRDQTSVSPASGIPHHLLSHNLMSSASSMIGQSHSTAFRVLDNKSSSRSQSPFKATSQQSHHPAAMAQPIDYCKSSNKSKPVTSAGSSPTNPGGNPPVSSPYHPSIAQPPVSLPPTSLAYSYSLIQQGLVPNPMYSHGPGSAAQKGTSHQPVTASSPTHCYPTSLPSNNNTTNIPSAPPGAKRKITKDNGVRKRQKAQNEMPNMSSPLSIPVTTPQILTNLNPYTTTTSNTPSRTSVMCSVAGTQPSTDNTSSVLSSPYNTASYMDSFKSFVENTVQSAYLEEEKKPPEKVVEVAPKPTIVNEDSSSSTVTNASNLSNNIASIMDTINRVANGHADTDSDTLSAPSPPPKSDSSPLSLSSSNHRNMKKAWLQRHSDASKEVKDGIVVNNMSDSAVDKASSVEAEETNSVDEDKPVCDNTQGVTLPNGNINSQNHNDESTSSASETESQSVDNTLPKKRVKTKKSNSGAKKIKTEEESSPVPPNNQTRKKPNNKRSKTDIKTEKKPETRKTNPVEEENSCDEKMDTTDSKSEDKMSSKASSVGSPAPSHHESDVSMESTTNSTGSNNTSSIKEKKKTRRSKENSKAVEKHEGSFNKPLVKVSVAILKRTCEPFVQDGPCVEIAPKLMKCRECKMSATQLSKKQPNIFCRFYAFRRLKYNPKGAVSIYGFSELSDADPDDIEPWLPRTPVQMPKLDIETSKFIITKVGDKFCELVEQERESMSLVGKNGKIAWKRAVQGVREMCDVCDTTLFNMHWVCNKCGFVVCLDCYKTKVKGGTDTKVDEDHRWLTCSSNRSAHEPDKMMLTQIIPSDALWELGRLIHDIRGKWSIPATCPCGHGSDSKFLNKNGLNQQIVNSVNNKKMVNGVGDEHHKPTKGKKNNKNPTTVNGNKTSTLDNYNPDTTSSPLSLLADVAFLDSEGSRDKNDSRKNSLDKSAISPSADLDSDKKSQPSCSTLRELLTKTAGKAKVSNDNNKKNSKPKTSGSTLDDIIQSVVEKSCRDSETQPFKFMHYIPRLGGWKRDIPIAVHNLTETSVLYPDVPHSWLCDGRLLRLHDPKHKGNLKIFQEQWKRGQPVLVSGTNKYVNLDLWRPESFSKEFGHIDNDLVNCRSGNVIIGHPMCDFWDGFEYLNKRPTDDEDEPMLLKLKDWPPGDDFSDLLPTRFHDLMQALPLPDYTHRQGKLNLASRLPDFLVRPDLGPKMYNAYGSSQFPSEGTTNLHLDISDAVNVMVYVGVPCDGDGGRKTHEQAALKAIDDADCDSITKRRVREVHEVPGALWQIYDAHDADKIRDFLNKVAKENGETIEPDHDPIHDQSWYLDEKLRERISKEYGVQGYTIVQCLGDAIFIPAGAPHQVRNLHSCVKVAEDFVAPEHLNHCFRLTQEFRQLSDTHSNHEDKLQVKNIIYHAVKDAVAVLRDTDPEDE